MATMKRKRPGDTPSTVRSDVLTQDGREFLFEHHSVYLDNQCRIMRGLAARHPDYRNAIAKALTCGRILARRSGNVPYERTQYCRQPKFCKICRHLLEANRAETRTDRLRFNNTEKCHEWLFTFLAPDSFLESLIYLKLASKAMNRLAKTIREWNRRMGRQSAQGIREYAIAIHTKLPTSGDNLWSHLHLVCVTGDAVATGSDSPNSLDRRLRDAFASAIGPDIEFLVRNQYHGKLVSKSKKKNSSSTAKLMDYSDVVAKFAYTTNPNEKDDTAEICLLRQKMFDVLEIKKPFITSRAYEPDKSPSSPASRLPNEFRPNELGKADVVVFGIPENDWTKIDPKDYDDTSRLLLADAKNYLTLPHRATFPAQRHPIIG